MLLNRTQLKELVAKLDAVRRDATGPGVGCYCTAPILTDSGENFRWEQKPTRPIGRLLQDGVTLVEAMPNGQAGIKIPLGVHGRSFLAIDLDSGQVCCAACAAKKGGVS